MSDQVYLLPRHRESPTWTGWRFTGRTRAFRV